MSVPAGADVFVNDRLTNSKGAERRYVSRGLKAGQNYKYTIQAKFVRDGKTVTETKSATLAAGGRVNMDFGVESASSTTVLTVNVPRDAKVTLAGNPTTQQGAVRKFATNRLSNGETWRNYAIQVETNRDGKIEMQSRTIDLVGGEARELTIGANDALLASN